eukprot:scaffold1809_cov386-Prasinococcus_capsulatus_cf.AAC.20
MAKVYPAATDITANSLPAKSIPRPDNRISRGHHCHRTLLNSTQPSPLTFDPCAWEDHPGDKATQDVASMSPQMPRSSIAPGARGQAGRPRMHVPPANAWYARREPWPLSAAQAFTLVR